MGAWKFFPESCVFAKFTPLTVSLAAGDLLRENFDYFVKQDRHLLFSIHSTYENLLFLMDVPRQKKLWKCIADLDNDVVKLHENNTVLLQDWGVSVERAEEKDIMVPTIYPFWRLLVRIVYMDQAGAKEHPTEIEVEDYPVFALATILSYWKMRTYVAQEISQVVRVDHHPYEKWILYYCSNAFKLYARRIEGVLDVLTASLTEEKIKVLDEQYKYAMQIQAEFFAVELMRPQRVFAPLHEWCTSMEPPEQWFLKPNSPEIDTDRLFKETVGISPNQCHVSIFFNFDLTCINGDTRKELVKLATCEDRVGANANAHSHLVSPQGSAKFQNIVQQYEKDRRNSRGSFDYNALTEALNKVGTHWSNANKEVVRKGLLRGLTRTAIQELGGRFRLGDGFQKFLDKREGMGSLYIHLYLVSRCWSEELIRSSLGSAKGIDVNCNELEFDDDGKATGRLLGSIETPKAKLEIFRSKERKHDLKRSFAESAQSFNKNMTVCIGGDGDVLSLLEADIGIACGLSPLMRRLLNAFGICFEPLFNGVVKNHVRYNNALERWGKSQRGVLYTVSSWIEIEAFVFGC